MYWSVWVERAGGVPEKKVGGANRIFFSLPQKWN
jgi:hypothetical protein